MMMRMSNSSVDIAPRVAAVVNRRALFEVIFCGVSGILLEYSWMQALVGVFPVRCISLVDIRRLD
jgi:hypothetical protein